MRAPLSEAQWQQIVIDLAHACGFEHNHTRRSIGRNRGWTTATSVVGWPDLTLYRPGRLIFAELKSETGKVAPEQERVLAALAAAGAETYVWRPSDLDAVKALLSRRCLAPERAASEAKT